MVTHTAMIAAMMRTASHPPSRNFSASSMSRMTAHTRNPAADSASLPSQYRPARRRAQYRHKAKSDNEKVRNTLRLYKPNNDEKLPAVQKRMMRNPSTLSSM